MGSLRYVPLLAVLLLPTRDSNASDSAQRCGTDRWAVKTFTDEDAARVSLTPIATTIAALGAIPILEVPYPANGRLAPHELTAYTVRGRVVAVKIEADYDVHVILADPQQPNATMIVEVPLSSCAANSTLHATFDAARSALLRLRPGSIVSVTGVGFFDFLHSARGQAPNGFELHPVFAVVPEP